MKRSLLLFLALPLCLSAVEHSPLTADEDARWQKASIAANDDPEVGAAHAEARRLSDAAQAAEAKYHAAREAAMKRSVPELVAKLEAAKKAQVEKEAALPGCESLTPDEVAIYKAEIAKRVVVKGEPDSAASDPRFPAIMVKIRAAREAALKARPVETKSVAGPTPDPAIRSKTAAKP